MPLRASSQPKMCFPRILKNLFFTDGKPLEETVEDLKKNPQKVLPKMKFVEFDGKTWSRSNRRLACYKRAGISELEEGVHFEMYPPDDHFFGGLDNRIFFARKEDFDTRTYCSLCAVPFSRRDMYVQHCLDRHGVYFNPTCMYCKKEFRTLSAQLEHECKVVAEMLSEQSMFCILCQREYPSNFAYLQHCRKVHGVSVGSRHCDYCGQDFGTAIGQAQHSEQFAERLRLLQLESKIEANRLRMSGNEVTFDMRIPMTSAAKLFNKKRYKRDVMELKYRFGITDVFITPDVEAEELLQVRGVKDAAKDFKQWVQNDILSRVPYRPFHAVHLTVKKMQAMRQLKECTLTLDSEEIKLMTEASFTNHIRHKIGMRKINALKVHFDCEEAEEFVFSKLALRSGRSSRIALLAW